MEQVYTPKQDYKVLVNCMTYNQSKYIEDALNGFAMQKTDFPFVCLVMDDASTDGEQEVIKAWMERECDMERAENHEIEKSFITLVPHKTNPNCTFAFYFLKENLYKTDGKTPLIAPWREHCEYEALCEGDDCWILPLKLQTQIRFLDLHEDYGVAYSGYKCLHNSTIKYQSVGTCPEGDVYEKLLKEWYGFICTPTTCFRISLYNEVKGFISQPHFKMGDLPLWLALAKLSKFKYFNDLFVVYRELDISASHFLEYKKTLEFDKNAQEIKFYFASLNNNSKYKDMLQKRIFQYDSLIALKENRIIDFAKFFIKARGINRFLLIQYVKNLRT